MSATTEPKSKREFIYLSERIKHLKAEQEQLKAKMGEFDKKNLEEAQRREHIYTAERLRRIGDEINAAVAERKVLAPQFVDKANA